MLLWGNEHTVRMVMSLLIEEKGKGWKVILPPLNPDNTNFMRIVNADVYITPRKGTIAFPTSKRTFSTTITDIARYSIGIYGHLHQRNKCECFSNPQQERILINFIDEMGLPLKDVKFLGENDMNLTLAPCMIDDDV